MPTYNNDKTLEKVINGILEYISPNDLIIVNDGSTDNTTEILSEFQDVNIFHLPTNSGKGSALRKGFKEALNLGYTHVITIDSDGQHFPENLPQFLKKAETEPGKLFIGSRDLNIEGMPSKNTFANKFSNFWFWFETGLLLDDTQSGFRLYPIQKMPKKWYSTKFEFEIETIVRSSWKDIPIENIPIQVKYGDERVSHFRPLQDFSRISVLNTILVTMTIFYILPRNFIRNFKKKKFSDFIKEDILGSNDSPKVKSISLALGAFIGIIPIWGFQSIVSIFLAASFRLNKGLAFAASNISIPPMIPIIVIASLKIGGLFLNTEIEEIDTYSIDNFRNHLMEYLLGSLILATGVALLVGFVSFILLNIKKKH